MISPCGGHTAAPRIYGSAIVAIDVVLRKASCRWRFRCQHSQACIKISAVICGFFGLKFCKLLALKLCARGVRRSASLCTKSQQNPSRIIAKSIQIYQNEAWDRFGRLLGRQLASGIPKVVRALYFLDAFWCHLGDFGRHFGTHWVPKGVPKSPFFS